VSIRVESFGLLTTIQDLGRRGFQHLGVGPGGAMDEASHRMANLLVGNPDPAPSLEMTLTGPNLQFETESMIALCGADLSPTIADQPVPLWRPVMVGAGSLLKFGRPAQGARCYLAVAGGFQVPKVMGSASTHLSAGFGGFQGRSLKVGDRLETGPCSTDRYPTLRKRFHQSQRPFLGSDWFAPWFRELEFIQPAHIRLIPGPQWPLLTGESRHSLLGTAFKVAPNSDRMGIRMQGPSLSLEQPLEMVSSGVARGTLQLPPDGSLILLMADRQTTGGYPRLGEVASVDLPKAAQLRPGETLRFSLISIEEAQELLLRREARLRDLEEILADQQTR
jgi:antagonist of KipI